MTGRTPPNGTLPNKTPPNKKRGRLVLALLCSPFLLNACDTIVAGAAGTYAYNVLTDPGTNITERNYAAADHLAHQAKTFIDKHSDIIKAQTLTDKQKPDLFSGIANVVPKQVATRFAELGYQVDYTEVDATPDIVPELRKQASFVLGGTYTWLNSSDMAVNLQIIDLKTRKVVARLDYTIPISAELRDMTTPETRIYKTTATPLQ